MSYNLQSEEDVKDFIKNLGIEYRFGCYSEKKAEVCHLLADYLESIDKNYDKARKVYQTTCDDFKYAKSCTKYATYALLGKGSQQKTDFPSAYSYFDKGCELGDATSCFHQGLLLITQNEKHGVSQDILKGMSLLEKSCAAEHNNACYYLSGIYIAGVGKQNVNKSHDKKTNESEKIPSVPRDMEKAFKFAFKGCELGNMYSCANVSQMYTKGDGVEKNPELAAKYKNIAAELQKDLQGGKTLSFQEGLT